MFFEPRPLVNLRLVDEVESLSPIMDIKVSICAASDSLCLCPSLAFLSCGILTYKHHHIAVPRIK